jgi:nucleoside 2-deoxyribosyltransferase
VNITHIICLSYPITAVRDSEPELLKQIQGPVLEQLEKMFIVFNPLTIKDMTLLSEDIKEDIPELLKELSPLAKELIKSRTIERDYRFIDQLDAVVVFYMTEKTSPGVLSEIYYAHKNQKPVYMVFPFLKSPFLEDAITYIEQDIDKMMDILEMFSKS